MTAPPLVLPANAIAAMCDEARRYAARGAETGGFLLTQPGTPDVVTVAVARDCGIDRDWGLFTIRRRAFDAIFTFAEESRLQARAMWHTHGGGAFLSRTDQTMGLLVRGFTSIVIPQFTNPSPHPGAWGWWTYDGRLWTASTPGRIAPDGAISRIVTFDEDGTRDR